MTSSGAATHASPAVPTFSQIRRDNWSSSNSEQPASRLAINLILVPLWICSGNLATNGVNLPNSPEFHTWQIFLTD